MLCKDGPPAYEIVNLLDSTFEVAGSVSVDDNGQIQTDLTSPIVFSSGATACPSVDAPASPSASSSRVFRNSIIAVVVVLIIALFLAILALLWFQRRLKRQLAAYDFTNDVEEFSEETGQTAHLPKEIPRKQINIISLLGKGQNFTTPIN